MAPNTTNPRIGRIARRIRRASGEQFWVEQVESVHGDSFNAIAGSKERVVKITRRLADTLTDDELAWVISHEFAHFQHDHTKKMTEMIQSRVRKMKDALRKMDSEIKKSGGGSFKRAAAQIFAGAVGTGAIYLVGNIESQKQETEADQRGLQIMERSGKGHSRLFHNALLVSRLKQT